MSPNPPNKRHPSSSHLTPTPNPKPQTPTYHEPYTPSHTQPFSPSHDELRIRDYAMASALVVGAYASIAIGFTLIGTCYAADAAFKRIFRKGGRHDVPR